MAEQLATTLLRRDIEIDEASTILDETFPCHHNQVQYREDDINF